MNLHLEPDDLRPLVQQVIAETMAALERDKAVLSPQRLAYTEAEAARMLGLEPHQLRDERLRGRIQCSRGPKNCVLYTTADLTNYLARRRLTGPA